MSNLNEQSRIGLRRDGDRPRSPADTLSRLPDRERNFKNLRNNVEVVERPFPSNCVTLGNPNRGPRVVMGEEVCKVLMNAFTNPHAEEIGIIAVEPCFDPMTKHSFLYIRRFEMARPISLQNIARITLDQSELTRINIQNQALYGRSYVNGSIHSHPGHGSTGPSSVDFGFMTMIFPNDCLPTVIVDPAHGLLSAVFINDQRGISSYGGIYLEGQAGKAFSQKYPWFSPATEYGQRVAPLGVSPTTPLSAVAADTSRITVHPSDTLPRLKIPTPQAGQRLKINGPGEMPTRELSSQPRIKVKENRGPDEHLWRAFMKKYGAILRDPSFSPSELKSKLPAGIGEAVLFLRKMFWGEDNS